MARPSKTTIRLRNARKALHGKQIAKPSTTTSNTKTGAGVCRQTIWRRQKRIQDLVKIGEAITKQRTTILQLLLLELPLFEIDKEYQLSKPITEHFIDIEYDQLITGFDHITIQSLKDGTSDHEVSILLDGQNKIEIVDRISYFEAIQCWLQEARASPSARKQRLDNGINTPN